MDLLAYFRVLRRHWRLIVAATVAGAALGAASTLLDRSSSNDQAYFRASHILVFDRANASSDGASARHYGNPNQVAILATTGDVPNRVATKLGTTETGRDLATRVSTTNSPDGETLGVTAIDRDPQRATLLADTFAEELIASLDAKEQDAFTQDLNALSAQVTRAQQDRDALLQQLLANPQDAFLSSQYQAAATNYGNLYGRYLRQQNAGPPTAAVATLEGAQPVPISSSEYDALLDAGETGRNHFQVSGEGNTFAAPSSGSSFNDPVSRGVLGGLLGFLAGVGLALLAHKLDRRLRSREEVEAAFELPVLAEVPKLTTTQQRQHELVAVSAPLFTAESYRAVRTSLLFQQAAAAADRGPTAPASGNGSGVDHDAIFEPEQHGPLVLMVTSAAPGEGKTTTSANLAAVFGEAGSSVLVLNCDFRRPSIHDLLGVADEPRRVQETAIPGVKVVTNVLADSSSNPAQVVAAQRQVIAAARDRFDVVILDTAPLLTANDAVEIVSAADLVLLVARPELSTTDSAQRSMDLLNRLDAPLAGVVLVAVAAVANDYYYYYQPGRVPEATGRGRKARNACTNGQAVVVPDDTSDIFRAEPDASDEPQTR